VLHILALAFFGALELSKIELNSVASTPETLKQPLSSINSPRRGHARRSRFVQSTHVISTSTNIGKLSPNGQGLLKKKMETTPGRPPCGLGASLDGCFLRQPIPSPALAMGAFAQ
jgi:hypothetical protein